MCSRSLTKLIQIFRWKIAFIIHIFKISSRLNRIRNVIVIKYINFLLRLCCVDGVWSGVESFLCVRLLYDDSATTAATEREYMKVTKGNWWMAEQKKFSFLFWFLFYFRLCHTYTYARTHGQRDTLTHNQIELHFVFMCMNIK